MLLFESTTNDGLQSMSIDDRLSDELRAFAGWELEYREAMGVFVDFDPAGHIRRAEWHNEAEARALVERGKREASELRQQVQGWRHRMREAARA